MEIDWITVSAQIVNFLILVWLLKRFLYQPVIRAMDRREQRIAERLNEAQEREQQADKKIQHYQEKSDELEHERAEILTQAREETAQEKKQMLEEARDEVAAIRQQWQRQANQEKEEFLGSLRRQASETIQTIARKVLSDLADVELEERIIHKFLERLKSLDKETRRALTETSEPVHITSAFELDSTMRGRITRAIHEDLADSIEVGYAQSRELLCGIELTSGGRRLSWNLEDYMDSLSARVEEAFNPTEPEKKEK